MKIRLLAAAMLATGFVASPAALLAAPQAAASADAIAAPAQHVPPIGLSFDGQHLAWIATRDGKAKLMLASWTGKDAHAVDIPGGCAASDLRWAPNWNTLAVATTCATSGHGAARGAIWVIDVHAGTAPTRLASLDGRASGLQWSAGAKDVAFLYTPTGSDAQEVAAVSAKGGALQTVTPAGWSVHAFRLTRIGNGIVFTAVPSGGASGAAPALYMRAGPKPELLFDPATASGTLRDVRVSLLRWSTNDSRVYFLGRAPGATADDIYDVVLSGHDVTNMTAGMKTKPAWFDVYAFGSNHGAILATEATDGQTRVARYVHSGSNSLRRGSVLFSLPGALGNGQEPSGVALPPARGAQRIAFAQLVPGHAPVIRSGVATNQPPPVVARGTSVATQ